MVPNNFDRVPTAPNIPKWQQNRHIPPAFVPTRLFSQAASSGKGNGDEEEEEKWSAEDIVGDFADDLDADEDEDDNANVDADDDLDDDDDDSKITSRIANVDDEDDDDKLDEIALNMVEEEEEEEDDDEAQYEEYSVASSRITRSESTVDWDEDEDGGVYELQDDEEDENYMIQKRLAEAAAVAAEQRYNDENFDPFEYMDNRGDGLGNAHDDENGGEAADGIEPIGRPGMSDEMKSILGSSDFMQEVEDISANMQLEEGDVQDMDLEDEAENVPDLMLDDPYPRRDADGDAEVAPPSGVLDDNDMELLDKTYKEMNEFMNTENWNKVEAKDRNGGWDELSQTTLDEIDDCLDEIGGSSYNVTRWLLYDLDFNVSNLILSAVKHNPKAPVLLHHWYPQLVTFERYQHARDRNFDFTWEDVENADMSELERYYAGFGYSEIPNKAPAETGIVSMEDMDEEEIKLASLQNWMTEVYNPEMDRKDFDDDDMQDEDNVFSPFYEAPQHPDLPKFEDAEEDLEEWQEEMGDDPSTNEYRDMMGQALEYTVIKDEEFEREFRGHLVIACSSDDADLAIAEQITQRFEQEFGKKVYVETRVMSLAREEDNVFEIWLESYEIDLLHSKRRATANLEDWDGPAVCDAAQIDYLVEEVGFLISDDARYSYRYELEHVDS